MDIELLAVKGDLGSDDFELRSTDLGPVHPADDGSWSTSFQLPDDPELRFAIDAGCVNVEGGRTFGYQFWPFDVREPGGPPIETPPGLWDDVAPGEPTPPTRSAAPAAPVRAQPAYTG